MKILVIGSTGQVACALKERAVLQSRHKIVSIGRPALDLTDLASVSRAMELSSPELVINAAAYTSVDQAEEDSEAAFAVNATGPGYLAGVCKKADIPIIHLSTDYVFDGAHPISYDEKQPECPVGVYGKSKLAGEKLVQKDNPEHFILRTAWVYSPFGNNFVKTMLRVAENRDVVNVVDDQIGTPTSALDIADALLQIADKLDSKQHPPTPGIYNLAGTGVSTWAGVARAVFAASKSLGGPTAEVNNISSTEYPTRAVRPLNSRLDCSKLYCAFGITLPNWTESVSKTVFRLLD